MKTHVGLDMILIYYYYLVIWRLKRTMFRKVFHTLYCRDEHFGVEVGWKSVECQETRVRVQWKSTGWVIASILTQKSKWTIILEKNK